MWMAPSHRLWACAQYKWVKEKARGLCQELFHLTVTFTVMD